MLIGVPLVGAIIFINFIAYAPKHYNDLKSEKVIFSTYKTIKNEFVLYTKDTSLYYVIRNYKDFDENISTIEEKCSNEELQVYYSEYKDDDKNP